ncbi:MAG: type II toxin-antitoxin system RelE/ParE family toxin [Wenzhouxiangellaceae bacterium]|nr:type II toxin-antitoxin system RelE/ParE family toxin [Wenzhouxiangellaceae bacterium]
MIRSFRHKGLKKFFETGSLAGVQADHAKRLRMLLAALDTAISVQDMDVPGFRLHRLKGKAEERWSVRVSGNWRLTFEFRDGQAHVVDYEDYH